MAKPKRPARPIAADNPHTAQLNVTVRPETIEGLDARAAEEAERTGYAVTRTDLVRRVLAIVASNPDALRVLLERA